MSWLVQFIPASGHRSLCKLVSALCLTPINQTLAEGNQQGSPDAKVWSAEISLPGTEQDRKGRNGSGESRQKTSTLTCLPACLPFSLLTLPHSFISHLMLILSDLYYYNLSLFPLLISYF